MDMFDEARSIKGMLDMRGMTQNQLAAVLGVSQPYIANKIRLLGFSESMQRAITEKGISERHARTLLKLPEELREEGLRRVSEGKMTVAQTEIMADCMIEEMEHRSLPDGINTAERIGRFEELIENSIRNLKLFGIRAGMKREKYLDKTYITVCIE